MLFILFEQSACQTFIWFSLSFFVAICWGFFNPYYVQLCYNQNLDIKSPHLCLHHNNVWYLIVMNYFWFSYVYYFHHNNRHDEDKRVKLHFLWKKVHFLTKKKDWNWLFVYVDFSDFYRKKTLVVWIFFFVELLLPMEEFLIKLSSKDSRT